MIRSPRGLHVDLSTRLEFSCTNNEIEYEALLHGLELFKGM
jgi:ribonuclease HI